MIKKHAEIRPHVIEGSLVIIAGNMCGIVFGRVDKNYYEVWSEGVMHEVHRDDFIVLRTGYEDDEEDEE